MLAYNANNELTQRVTITQEGLKVTEVTTTYQYDAFGRRISKLSQTKEKTKVVSKQSGKVIAFPVQTEKTHHIKVHYLWDGNRQLQEQTDTHIFTTIYEQDSFEPVARLVWLQDGIEIAANEPEYRSVWDDKPKPQSDIQIYHCHNDHLGTPNELTTYEGEVVWLADYEAYGNTAKVVWREEKLGQIQVSVEELQPIRFQGQYYDEETGLHYNRFRYFDPDLGMFTTRDPIGLLGGSNVFQYAPNPTGWIDPFGLSKAGIYEVFAEARLPQSMYRMSDGRHFQEANRQLYYKMKNDPVLKQAIESRYPGTFDKVSPGKRGAFPRKPPPNLTWHHHEKVGGLLQMVDREDHNLRHKDYHPNGKGGRNKWGGGTKCR